MNVLPVHFRGALTSVAASLLFLFCTTVSFAQESDPFVYESHIVASPEAYEMSKHGSLKPNLNTGAMTYSLPIYTYQDKDFYLAQEEVNKKGDNGKNQTEALRNDQSNNK